jgi:hypothetical protein
MIAAGLYPMETLLQDLANGGMNDFSDFLAALDDRVASAGLPGLGVIHTEVAGNFRAGDPTPFKSFREQEYLTTTGRMSPDAGGVQLEVVLRERITLNYEVAQVLTYLRERGALALGLSDKPDEAVFPTPELAAQGQPPLHRAITLLVGERLDWGNPR